jgi:DNA polymerase III delta prime subunit
MVPPEPRLPQARGLIEHFGYFVVHAPRQTGKTTTLRALARSLTADGRYAALHFSCEVGAPARSDFPGAQRAILDQIRERSLQELPPDLRPDDPWPASNPESLLSRALAAWARACPRPLVLFFDEIDALTDESLIAVLRQLRAGFPDRPVHFPASVVLCGLRDVRDYRVASGGDPTRLGTASPFNVKVESLRLGNLTADDVASLYGQHTAETGQQFTEEALARAVELTGGQPWLVNALAREVVEKMGVPLGEAVAAEHIEEAKERLVLARETHLDSLVSKLLEPRVRRIIAPLIAGDLLGGDAYDDDFSYVRDLGLVDAGRPPQVANPVYREVMVRVLAQAAEDNVTVDPRAFVLQDGTLDMRRLLEEFAAFWREHGDVLQTRLPYHEVAPQLVLMAFLQRIVNGGGYVDREYGVGRGRIDLLVRWPYSGPDGKRQWQREAVEIKVWADRRPDPLARGLEQIDAYLARLGLDRGVLALFDRRTRARAIEKRTRFDQARTASGREISVLRG